MLFRTLNKLPTYIEWLLFCCVLFPVNLEPRSPTHFSVKQSEIWVQEQFPVYNRAGGGGGGGEREGSMDNIIRKNYTRSSVHKRVV